MSAWHLAQINVARAVAPLDSPDMAGFVHTGNPTIQGNEGTAGVSRVDHRVGLNHVVDDLAIRR